MAEPIKQIGWTIAPLYEPLKGAMHTNAFIMCMRCRGTVSSVNGPRDHAYCMKCAPIIAAELAMRGG